MPVLAAFEKRRAQVLNEAEKEKIEMIESQKGMAPMILGSSATAEASNGNTTSSPKSPLGKLNTRRLSFGELILSRRNSSLDNGDNENESVPHSPYVKSTKNIGKQNISLPALDTSAESNFSQYLTLKLFIWLTFLLTSLPVMQSDLSLSRESIKKYS